MDTNRFPHRRAAVAATAAAAGLALAACGSQGDTSTATSSPATTAPTAARQSDRHNQADVTFAQGMIPHHLQALVMSDMVESHGATSEVEALAEKIKKAQKPEIDTMTGWLEAWGEEVPTGMDGMGHGDDTTGMPGMMGDQDMNRLGQANGSTFDDMFLTMMIEHHEGAIDMAKTEKREGAYGPATALADSIITSQTAEIAQMRMMLNAT
ncbi:MULTISPECIES: DUF305 domain-containing protein [Streptomycetaceae]|uniref:DUF305 domain-containing protein n=1 Tax=unclassified Streptomyces TaxID=2593676 RepID=UPI0033704D02